MGFCFGKKLKKMKSYITPIRRATQLRGVESYEAESIERKLQRLMVGGKISEDRIEAKSPLIYTPRAEGVNPEYNIKTSKWDVALDAMDKQAAYIRGKREEAAVKAIEEANPPKTGDLGGEGGA